MVFTVNKTVISKPLISYSTPVNSIGKGWQSGRMSGVRLTPNKPAALLMANTLPLGTVSFLIASMVSSLLTFTIACAVAVLRVVVLWVMSIIIWFLVFGFWFLVFG